MNQLSDDSPKIILGPIIGKVTQNSARIAIEFDLSQDIKEVVCFIVSDKAQHSCRRQPQKGFPTVFKFEGLEPKTQYAVFVKNAPPLKSKFKTLRKEEDQPGSFHFAVVSCNDATKAVNKKLNQDLWFDIVKRVSLLDYIFHIGNQCYMDSSEENQDTPYEICKRKLESIPREEWGNLTQELLEVLRTQYRKTWSHLPTATVLANVPNLMILNEHDLRAEWGWRPEDSDPLTAKCDYFYGKLARRVYYEYQRQLMEDIDWENLDHMKCEYHEHIFNEVGVVFLDYRGSRTWFREQHTKEIHLGIDQVKWVCDLFSNQGRFTNINSVILISPIPLFCFSHLFGHPQAVLKEEPKEHWTSKNIKELKKLVDTFRDWKSKKKGKEVTLVSGSINIGGHTEIFEGRNMLFKQFTTSGINSQIPKKDETLIKEFLETNNGKLKGNFSYVHYNWVKENNYGLVDMKNTKGEAFVEYTLVKSDMIDIRALETHNNKNWQTKTSCFCIF